MHLWRFVCHLYRAPLLFLLFPPLSGLINAAFSLLYLLIARRACFTVEALTHSVSVVVTALLHHWRSDRGTPFKTRIVVLFAVMISFSISSCSFELMSGCIPPGMSVARRCFQQLPHRLFQSVFTHILWQYLYNHNYTIACIYNCNLGFNCKSTYQSWAIWLICSIHFVLRYDAILP